MKRTLLLLFVTVYPLFLFSVKMEYNPKSNKGKIKYKNKKMEVNFYENNRENVYYFLKFTETVIQLREIYNKFMPQKLSNKVDESFDHPILIIESKRGNYERMRQFKNEVPITVSHGNIEMNAYLGLIHEDVETYLSFQNDWEANTRWFREGCCNYSSYFFVNKIFDDNSSEIYKWLKKDYETLEKVYQEIDLKNFLLRRTSQDQIKWMNEQLRNGRSIENITYELEEKQHVKELPLVVEHYLASQFIFFYLLKGDSAAKLKDILIEVSSYTGKVDNEKLYNVIKDISGYDVQSWYDDFPRFWRQRRKEIKRIIKSWN